MQTIVLAVLAALIVICVSRPVSQKTAKSEALAKRYTDDDEYAEEESQEYYDYKEGTDDDYVDDDDTALEAAYEAEDDDQWNDEWDDDGQEWTDDGEWDGDNYDDEEFEADDSAYAALEDEYSKEDLDENNNAKADTVEDDDIKQQQPPVEAEKSQLATVANEAQATEAQSEQVPTDSPSTDNAVATSIDAGATMTTSNVKISIVQTTSTTQKTSAALTAANSAEGDNAPTTSGQGNSTFLLILFVIGCVVICGLVYRFTNTFGRISAFVQAPFSKNTTLEEGNHNRGTYAPVPVFASHTNAD